MPQTDPSDADNQPEGDARPDAPSNSSARASGNGWVRWLKRLAILCFVGVLTGFGFVWYTNHVARRAGEGILFDDVDAVPEGRVGLVFGCSKKIGGRDNRYFKYRIEAAAELFQAGKVNVLIVSGDNRKLNYNEPIDMKNALIAKGIPSDRIVCDYAGLRTLDSVVRAKKIFGLNEVTFISQKFQNERAAYIAQSYGMKVYGYNAKRVDGNAAKKTEDREVLARVKMWLDVNITDKQPKHLGDTEPLPSDDD